MKSMRNTHTNSGAAQAAPLPVICLAGPTGSGKTAAALAMADALDGEVINADSRQVYADFSLHNGGSPRPKNAPTARTTSTAFCPQRKKSARAALRPALARDILARADAPPGGRHGAAFTLLHGTAQIPPVDPALTLALTDRMEADGAARMHAEQPRWTRNTPPHPSQ